MKLCKRISQCELLLLRYGYDKILNQKSTLSHEFRSCSTQNRPIAVKIGTNIPEGPCYEPSRIQLPRPDRSLVINFLRNEGIPMFKIHYLPAATEATSDVH